MDRESLSEWAKDKPLSILQLDPADRAVLRIADERDAIQKKTFTKWVNKHLIKASRRVDDLFEDLRDGHNLLSLLEVLSGEHLPREKGKMRFHMLQNAQMALDFLRYKKIKLVNIRAEDIVDGNPKLTLGLIWTIILHFQISDIVVGQEDNLSAREALLRWARRSTARYPNVRVNDFTGSWRDGLAFSAIIHRNRPDLLDWRKTRSARPRERLENAFHIVEKEYGVTKLLDPEDVDTNEPDEKSLITYISSLYDVFPEPPSIHPLFDTDSQRRVNEYKDLAQQFLYWCREKTALLQDRIFPTTLIEMKRLLHDLNRFRSDEMPPRQHEKQKLVKIYKELEKYFESIGEVEIAADYRPEAIEKAWQRLQQALSDRDNILQQEVERLERLQRLADKVQREIKHTDTKLTDLEDRITEDARRIERLHPVDAKNLVEALETEIRHLEPIIQELHADCNILKEERYPQANELYKKVTKLHQRWSQLRAAFHTNLIQKLAGLRYPVQETTVTRQTRTVMETRQVDTNPYFKDLQEYTEWCQNKLKQLLSADYGSDLPSVKQELDHHQQEHRTIDQFHSKVVHAERQQANFSGEELHLYEQRLSQLQKVYAELLATSTKRLSDLDALQDFLSAATSELQWLNDREQIEISRDWADKNLDLPSIHRYYENLMSELEKREMHFAKILDRGENLLLQQHPAAKCIEGHLQALQSQWSWLLQLTLCLEVHLKHATEYHSFFAEVKEAENWLAKRDEILNTKYSQSDFGLDQGEALLRGMQDIREELNTFGETVIQLAQRSQIIVPLKQRRQPVTKPLPVQAICAYKQSNVSIEKGETCTLLDTSGRVKWVIRSPKGVEAPVPGTCFLLPPPDQEAIDAVERLRRFFDRSVALWQKKQLRLRQNMIFATIKVVKSWDFEQFLAMGPEQRTAIRRALNDDADKLLSEGDNADPQLRRLRREMDEVNRLFDEFEKRARAEEESKQASRIFTEECISFKNKLEAMARELDHIILSPLPRDLDSLEHAVQIHEDYSRRLNMLEPDVKHLKETFRTIALKTPALKKNLDNLTDLWTELNTQSGLHGERLKLLADALAGLEDNEQVISDLEGALSRHQELPSSPEGLHDLFKQLTKMQDVVQQQQPQIDKMNDSADQLGRMGVPTKVLEDLKRLHSNVERLNVRWNNVCGQLADRLRSCETGISLMKNLQSGLQVEENWVDGATDKLAALPTATSARELDSLLGAAVERTPKIEQVNVTGGRLIREAKIYDVKCLNFVDWLVEMRPSFSPPRHDVRLSAEPGATEVYTQRLDMLNTKFERLLFNLSQRLRTAVEVNGDDRVRFAESLQKPLRTYRVEFNLSGNSGEIPSVETYKTSIITSPTGTQPQQYKTHESTTTVCDTIDSNIKRYSSTEYEKTTKIQQNIKETAVLQFSEIRSTKKVPQKQATQQYDLDALNEPGIKHPVTGQILTIGEAIRLQILDVRTGDILINENGDRISLEEATVNNLIDPKLVQKLLQPGAAVDYNGRAISLLEVIQKQITEAENGNVSALAKIKVTTSDDSNSSTATSHTNTATTSSTKTVLSKFFDDAILEGMIDAKSGLYRTELGETLTLREAYDKGYLVTATEKVRIKSSALCLSDALVHGLIDNNGWVVDRNTGEKIRLDSAIASKLIDGNVREVVDAKNDVKVTVQHALDSGMLNAKVGRFVHSSTKEKMSFAEAKKRQLIQKPMTLKDVCDFNLYDKNAKIFSPTRQSKLSIVEAMSVGVLDSDQLKCVTKDSSELVTLSQAIVEGIILPEGKYRNVSSGEILTIPEAVDRGFISSVSKKSLFNIDAFKDPYSGDFVALNDALSKNILHKSSLAFVLDSGKNNLVSLEEGLKSDLVRPEVYSMLCRKVGVFDASGSELSVLDLVFYELIDPKTGYLLDPKTKQPVPLNEAIDADFITHEGALLLSSLLNITLTTETVTKQIKHYVTIMDAVPPQQTMRFTDAIDSGVIDREVFTDPATGNTYSIQQALNYGLISSDDTKPESTTSSPSKQATITIVKKSFITNTEEDLEQSGKQKRDSIKKNKKPLSVEETASPEPLLIDTGVIYDPLTSLVIFTESGGESKNILTAVSEGRVDANLVKIKDPINNRDITIKEALERGLINPQTGEIKYPGKNIDLVTAAKMGVLTVLGAPLVAASEAIKLLKLVRDPKTGQDIPIELAYERGIVTREELISSTQDEFDYRQPSEAELTRARITNEPKYQVSIGKAVTKRPSKEAKPVILQKIRKKVITSKDAFESGIIDKETANLLDKRETFISAKGDPLTLTEAISENKLDGNSGAIVDPQRSDIVNINQAMERGILDADGTNQILVPLAKSLSVPELKEQGLLDRSENKIIHPETGSLLTLREAIICEIVDPLSHMADSEGNKKITLGDAIRNGKVNDDDSVVTTEKGSVDLLTAVSSNVFSDEVSKSNDNIPPVGMTFNVAVKRGLVDTQTKEVIHPITNKRKPITEAIKDNFIMALPYTPSQESVSIEEALDLNLIDTDKSLFKNPRNNEKIPIAEAIDQGLLVVKSLPELVAIHSSGPMKSVTETVTSYHTVVTKTVQLMTGYILSDSGMVQHVSTGDSLTIEEAKEKGIATDGEDVEKQYATKVIKISFTEALEQGLINKSTGIYRDPSTGNEISIQQAINDGLVDDHFIQEYKLLKEEKNLLSQKSVDDESKLKREFELQSIDRTDEVREPKIAKMEGSSDDVKLLRELSTEKKSPDSYHIETSTLNINEMLSVEYLTEIGVYDPESDCFINPQTGDRISFQTAIYELGIFDPNLIHVLDLNGNVYEPIDVALERPLINKNTGYMVDNRSGKRIPFSECVRRGWIIQKESVIEKPFNFEELISSNCVDPRTGGIMCKDGQTIPLVEAIRSGMISADSVSVRNPITLEIIPLQVAIERGIVDLQRGIVLNVSQMIEMTITEAFVQGWLISGIKRPISLEAAVRNNMYDSDAGRMVDPDSSERITVDESVKKGIVDPFISNIVDTLTNENVPLKEALESKLLDSDTGKIYDGQLRQWVSLDSAVQEHIITTQTIVWDLIEVISNKYYDPQTGLILDPRSGEKVTLKEAIKTNGGFVEVDTALVKNNKNEILPVTDAIETGLIDGKTGCLTKPLLTLDQAYEKGLILSTKKPLSLISLIERGLYDPKQGTFEIDNKLLILSKAIEQEFIDSNEMIVNNIKTGEILSLREAIKQNIIDPDDGVVYHPISKAPLNFSEAYDQSILIQPKRKYSLPDAVFCGVYNPTSGQFSHAITSEKLNTEHAIKRGLIDPDSTVVSISDKVVPFEKALKDGLVDARGGTVDDNGSKIDFKEAFDRGVLVEIRKPIALGEALLKNLQDEQTGLFIDPSTSKKWTIAQSLENHLIDPHSVQVKDTKLGIFKNMSLQDAIKTNFINPNDARVSYNNERITLREAFNEGLLADRDASVSLQRVLHQGLYDEPTRKIIDSKTGRKITLHEAIRRSIINPSLPCCFIEKDETFLSLADCCRLGLVDRRDGSFKNTEDSPGISLPRAMSLGYIIDIESASFGLYEALKLGLYDSNSQMMIHPVTSKTMTLRDACIEDLVNPVLSRVKAIPSGKYVTLDDAIKMNIIDDIKGIYILPNGQEINLQEAKSKYLIVTVKKMLSIEEILKCDLFRPNTGKFINPSSGDGYDLNTALNNGFISPYTTMLKDALNGQLKTLRQGIDEGDIDVAKGKVLDTISKRPISYDVAFQKGILITVQRPVTDKLDVIHESSGDDSSLSPVRGMREMTLDEAIQYEVINPETAVVKDPESGQFKSLRVILDENKSIDRQMSTVIDPKASFFVFDPAFIVYVREPVTFDQALDSNLLNLTTGKFTEPSDIEKVYSLKESFGLGLIDPDSVLIKDNAKKKLYHLPEAFRKGLMDADKANVVDTMTSKLHTLQSSLEHGLLVTPKRSFGLLEAIAFNLYNPVTGSFNDPFITTSVIDRKRLKLADAITSGLIDPTTTMVRESANSAIVPLVTAIQSGVVDSIEGRLIGPDSKPIDFIKATEKGLLLPAEQRQSVIEKFNLCEDNLSGLLKWVGKIEKKIASIGRPNEVIDEIRNQINLLKQVKEEIDGQSRPVASCLEQVRQLVLTAGDVLSAPEVSALENSGRELRTRLDRAQDRANKLLKKLESARDELGKLGSEMDIFVNWLNSARRTLEDKEQSLSVLTRLESHTDSIRDFVSDVIAHQADLRFIQMSAQKFVDESKDYLNSLNDYRTTLPDRMPHIEPLPNSESPIRKEVQLISAHYKDLQHRANALSDRLSGLGGRQKEYRDALDKATEWLKSVQPRVNTVLSDPIGADPQTVQDQIADAKTLHNEFLTQGRLVDNCQQALDTLLRTMSGQLSPSDISSLEIPVEELKQKYEQNLEALGNRCQLLDQALVQSQGVQDALDGLVNWINQSEDKFKTNYRPISLIRERLLEQIRDHKHLLSDLEQHQTSVDSVVSSAQNLIDTASNARIAKKIESKLVEVSTRYEKLYEKALNRRGVLEDVLQKLTKFLDESAVLETELTKMQQTLEGRELNSLPIDEFNRRVIEINRVKEQLRPMYEGCVQNGKDLVAQRDVTDTGPVRDEVKSLENLWKSLEISLEEKINLSKQKVEHLNAYENLKDQVLSWLSNMEYKVNDLPQVAIDLDVIKRQYEELKPLTKEYRNFAPTIDKINDVGSQYDALIRPDSPTRKHSSYNSLKRVVPSPVRRLSGDRSPSPTKSLLLGQNPLGGSRRPSEDGFTLTDLSPVQQQLTEINNRYGLIGIRLNDRQNEIDNVRDEVKKYQDNLKSLGVFLDKIQRQVPKDKISNKEEADRCTKQARKVLEEMYEKQSVLDSTKAQVKDMLKRKPDVQGADKLRTELDDIVEKWKKLYDLCKDKINYSEQLRDFLDTHDNLNTWLNAKDKMFTVLGPISSDPRMVQSQVQQVQVMREEFRGQQPILNHFVEIGNSVVDHLKSSPEGQAVKSKLQSTQNKWDDLVSKLDERANSLGAAADTSKEFDAGLNRLREALQAISDNLDSLPTDRDHQDTLRKIENLERQLEGQRPLLADAESAAEALCNVLGDPASRADVNSRVQALGKQYQNLQKKLDNRKAETEAALRDSRQFNETCAKTLGWLSGELSNLSERLQISAHKPTLQHQIDTHEPIYREVMAREHEIIMLLNRGKEHQEKSGTSADRTLQRDLDKISQQWEKLRREAVDRHTRLQTCMEHCKKYGQASDSFFGWMRVAEDKLNSFKPGVLKKAEIEQQLRDLQAFRSDVWKKSGEYESTRSLGDTFLSACDTGKEPVKAELQDMKERWEKLNNDLVATAAALDNSSRRLGDFNDELRDLDHAVGRCEDRLAAHDSLGGAGRDPKLLERVKAIREDTQNLKKPLQNLRKLTADIVGETQAAGGNADHLQANVESIADRIDDLQSRLNDRCGELQSAATAVTQFNEQVKNLGLDLQDLEVQVDSLSPPAREIKLVQIQLRDVAGILTKIEDMVDRTNDIERAGESLVDSGFSPDIVQTREQTAGLRRTLARLENRGKDHEDTLNKALKALEKFYDAHKAVIEDLGEVSTQLKKMKPVSSELEQIRSQQDDLRFFRTRTVEPLAQNIGDVNRLGQDLVRSALGGVSTNQLEKDLERMNEVWNDLKERLNERERRLDVALLQSGKFQEALDGLSKWLGDTEEMVANQKPPSADYKVVKAQLQEQKFLKKMLLDRQNSMSSLFQLGQEVAANCEPAEKAGIERQLKELMGRFDKLTDTAQARTLDLEEAMRVAKLFQDKLNPLSKWLDTTERAVRAMELVPTDEEKIQQRIREHDALHDDILSKKPDFSELADIAGQLMELVGDEEGVVLGEKVKVITDRYTNLVDGSDAVGQLLDDSRQGLRHLVLTYQELVSWMESMEQRLGRFRIIPVHIEKLLEHMDALVELNEEIANRAQDIESTVKTGSELMKHITADEAIQLKDKLDSIQRRYGELASKGGDLLKNIQEALPVLQRFYDSHNRLVEWMQGAEAVVTTGEAKESDILRLEGELSEMRPKLESVNSIGPQLCQISPGEGASTIEGLVTRDNRRFDAIVEQIQRKAERFHLSKQRSKEVAGDIDELLEWFREMDANLREAELPGMDPKYVRAQLQEHRSINDEISSQKGRVRDVTSAAKKVLRETQPSDNTVVLREKMEDLKEVVDSVAQLCSDRLTVLEQALPLSEHFIESHNATSSWLDDMEHQIEILSAPGVRPEQIAQQQDKNERLLQSIAEHKPLIDKLNKTGEALASLVSDDDAVKIQDIVENDNARYQALKVELRERQQALEQAMQESSQFSDKLEGMLRALSNTADQVNQADPVSAHPPKIREQIEENAALVDDLDKRGEAFAAVKRAASDVIAKAGNQSDPAVRDIKKKLDKLNQLWNDLQKATSKRGSNLDDTLAIAEKFWKQLQVVMETLKELEENLSSQEPPAAQPQEIQKQQVALQEIRQEIDLTKPEVEEVRRTGTSLISMCGEPDKPEVKKQIEDLDNAWDNITALYAKREENLIDAMEKAMEFHETLANLNKFLDKAEDKFSRLGPLGSDIDAVKKQIDQLRRFKDEVDPHMVEIESLNRQAIDLTERTSPKQAAAIRDPLNNVNKRWENLLRGMVERQKQLEHALLHLGQFQHALNELLVWINKTDSTLDQLKPIPGDPQLLEVELAKLKVLANDVQAHQSSIDTLNDAGRQLIESEKGSIEASTTQEKLGTLNNKWRDLLLKANDRQHELEEALREAQSFIAEVQDILGWLGDVDAIIGASKPVGGLPETASEQLERFMEIYNEMEENRPKVETLQAQGQEYIKKQSSMNVSSNNLQHILRTLKQRWDAVLSRASDKKIKLEIALKEATEFHDALQEFIEWLTSAEKQLSQAAPVSRVLEVIQVQIEEHKILQKDVSIHREAMLLLDKKGTHLKYFSQKQDVILIKNLLVSVQHRWERVVAKAAERTRGLDHGYKEAREFFEMWQQLIQWLQETETTLNQLSDEAATSNDPEKIKKHLDRLKETQRNLSAKQGQYDQTMRSGKHLIDRAPKTDEPVLSKMLSELKETWTRVCTKSVDRQRKLEEALLLSGQFSEALQALLDWLKKQKAKLQDDGPVHGDLETVSALMDQHKHLESDLQKRSSQMESVLKTGRNLEKSGDNRGISKNLQELQTLWTDVERLSSRRGQRLEDALREAEQLHKQVNMLLEWLSDAEQKLRFAAALPDNENHAQELLDMHTKFLQELREKEHDKNDTLRLAQSILAKAHPDAISIIKNWITIIQSRWDEVSQWAIGRESKLREQLQSLRDLDDTIEELLAWLAGLESTLLNLENEALPDEIPVLEQLINDHREFMENTARRQPEVDRACKPKLPPAGSKDARKPSRIAKTPVRGSQHDLHEHSPDRNMGRKQSFKGSRDHGLNSAANRRPSRVSPGRGETPERDRLPHFGPRFSPSTGTTSEVEFRSSRAKLLWDKWRYVWMLAWERQRRLHDHLMYLKDVERVKQFSWDEWRKRFLKFMNHKKSRLTDLFRKMDKDNNGLIPREVFVDGIINTKFDTTRLEMGAVADLFDRNGEGLIDWQEFIAALRPDWEDHKPKTDSDKIHDEVKRLVMLCTCRQKFRVFQVGEGKYRFGDSQKLRLVRILRSTVMVRVGGGWCALDEFLLKNDPCRAKGRTNIELREQFILADGVSQQMAAFKPRRRSSQDTSNTTSPVPMSSQGPITKVRERSARSVAMSRPSRSSLSASTPDSLSDNESSLGVSGRFTPRKPSYTPTATRTGLTPAGSRTSSKPNSRPVSRTGSKPPSRHGSTLSLDSTDETTPSRIPTRRTTNIVSSTPRPTRLSVGASTLSSASKTVNGGASNVAFGSSSRPRTPSGSASPAPTSKSRIPVRVPSLRGNKSQDSDSPRQDSISSNFSSTGRNISGASTPSGMQTPRRPSTSTDTPPSGAAQRKGRGTTPISQREPFRL